MNTFLKMIIAILMTQILVAQVEKSEQTSELILKGKFRQAEQLYTQLLSGSSSIIAYRVGRADVRAWLGKYDLAFADYKVALEQETDNTDALNGLGYLMAWQGNYVEAEKYFSEALRVDESLISAQRGLAWVNLWSGDAWSAIRGFKGILESNPDDAESIRAIGQSYLFLGNHSQSRDYFKRALDKNSSDREAMKLLNSVRYAPAGLDIQIWGGYSSLNSADELGLRNVELATQASRSARFWLRYDNSLSLDNIALLRSNTGVPAYYAGGYAAWNTSIGTRIEAGYRELPGANTQMIYSLEQLFYLEGGSLFKLGGFIAPVENENEWLAYGGVGLPLSDAVRIEPMVYIAGISGSDQGQVRYALNADWQLPNQYALHGGGYFGSINVPGNGSSNSVAGGHLMLDVPVAEAHWLKLMIKYESDSFVDSFVSALGFTFRLER